MGYFYRNGVLSPMTKEYSDVELIELISKSDSSAFSFLYKMYYNMVRNLVEKNAGSSDDASDLFQEVLIILYEKIRDNKLRLTCSMKTYIYSVARNQWLKNLKARKQHTTFNNFENYIAIEEESEVSTPLELGNLLNAIGDACRKLLVLFYYRKMSMEQIGVELNYSNADSVKNQKYKCIQRLKKIVANKM
jgi:RNA polymerase sigma factor (sigma-70 family)